MFVQRSDRGAGAFDLELNYGTVQADVPSTTRTGRSRWSGGAMVFAGGRQVWASEGGGFAGAVVDGGTQSLVGDGLGSSTPSRYVIGFGTVDLVAHRTGGKFGDAVSEDVESGGDPTQYLILTNNDFEEGVSGGEREYFNDSAAIPNSNGGDDDLAKITLKTTAWRHLVGPLQRRRRARQPGRSKQERVALEAKRRREALT